MTMTPTDRETARMFALVDLARLAEDADHDGETRTAHLYQLAHTIAEVAASPVLAHPTYDEARQIVDAIDHAALELFRVSYNVEHG